MGWIHLWGAIAIVVAVMAGRASLGNIAINTVRISDVVAVHVRSLSRAVVHVSRVRDRITRQTVLVVMRLLI